MMVASKFATFSLTSEGLMTTAFPAEHRKSEGAQCSALPGTKPGGSLPLLCPQKSGQKSYGHMPQEPQHLPHAVDEMREEREREGEKNILGPSRAD